jgi:vitamin B12 transporter
MKHISSSLVFGLALLSFNLQVSAANTQQVEEVIVSASLLPLEATRSANAITVIDSEQIKSRAALSVSDLLRDVPGLAVSRSGVLGSLTDIRARGAEANHLLVLVDGVEINDPSQSDQLNWGTLSTTGIERIEIVRGPQSSMRGSDAIAGIINIITASADKPFSADVYSEAGSWSTTRNGFSLGHQSENFNMRFGASHIESEGTNVRPLTGSTDRDGYRNTGLNLKANYQFNAQTALSFMSRYTNGMAEFDDSFSEDHYSDFNRGLTQIKSSYNSNDGLWSHSASIAVANFENDNFNAGSPNGSTESSKQNYSYIGSRYWEVANQRLSLALKREEEEFKQFGGWATGADANRFVERNTDSVALEYRFDPNDSITLALSSRYEDNDQFKSSTTQRFEAVYQHHENLRFRGAWGTAVKNPTFTELYGIYGGFQSNPNLIPEKSKSWELGFDRSLLEGRLEFGATYFDAQLENEIIGFGMPQNANGLSERQGAELSSSLVVNDSLSVTAAYTYTDSVDASGIDEKRRPKNIGSINLAWQAQPDTKVNVNIQYNGSQIDSALAWGDPDVTLKAFTLVNVNVAYSPSNLLDVYMSLINLFDEDYQEVNGYATLGFGANLGLRYKF